MLPHVWPISPTIANNRLSFPVTYWNVEGLVAALGIGLCLHLSSDLREPALSRILAAGAMPILASTLLFTFSRGAIATCVIVLVVYVLLGRPRGLVSSLVAIGPATAIAAQGVLRRKPAGHPQPDNPGSGAAGTPCGHGGRSLHRRCAPVAGCPGRCAGRPVAKVSRARRRLAPARLDRLGRSGRGGGDPGLAFRHTISSEYHGFLQPPQVAGNSTDLRARLTDPSNNGRLDNWKVAVRGFDSAPVLGHGAGTYQDRWARYRPNTHFVLDAHSLYLETLDELGIAGLVLLLIPLLTILVRAASRIRGRGRPLYAVVFALLLGWAVHAGVDWDWEMPVVTVIFFSLGGFILGRRINPEAQGDGAGGRERGQARSEATRSDPRARSERPGKRDSS